MSESLTYRLVEAADIPAVFALETASFPADEAATLESLTYRQSVAPKLFLGAFTPANELVAFTCSTSTPSSTLTHDSMSTHIPSSPYVAIHSICVSPNHRRKGLAGSLLKEYIKRMKEEKGVRGLRLISHAYLIKFYESCGFQNKGESSVVHGSEKWYELGLDFEPAQEVEVVEAGKEPPSIRNPGYSFGSFERTGDWRIELVNKENSTNAKALYCPRDECRSLILRKGVAKFVSGHADDLFLPPLPQPIASPSPPTTATKSYWSLPSPLSFENIGFTKNVSSTPSNPTPNTIKYLTCADCDFGPLGWHDTQGRDLGIEVELENSGQTKEGEKSEVRKGREFLIGVERARYF